MPPKNKKASASAAKKCDLCTGVIKNGEDTLQCSGTCQGYVHRYCAGVTVKHYQELIDNSTPFCCLLCTQQSHSAKINDLQNELSSLRRALAAVQWSPSPTLEKGGGNSVSGSLSKQSASFQPKDPLASKRSYANALSSSLQNKASNPDRKFCVVVYGLNENPKGTPKHCRISNNVKSASELIQPLCPELTEQSIRDCSRLGKYTSDRNRPLLIQLFRSCDASSILLNRRTLVQTPKVFIKPYMSHKERTTESTLLRERRSLINSGIERSSIRLHGNTLYINKKKYGYANESIFNLCQPNNINSTIVQQDTQPEQPSPTLTLSSPNVEEEFQS